jgi:amidophosphoribosyltransferase
MRDVGAEAVHVRIGAPPIVAPCYMGIDMAARDELIAADQSPEAVAESVGADSLAYLSPEAVCDALDADSADLCLGCVTGKYPYDVDGEERDRAAERPSVTADD